MDRATFQQALQLESMPLCNTCKEMLYSWAGSDPRTEGNASLWADFVRHFIECRTCYKMQHDPVAA